MDENLRRAAIQAKISELLDQLPTGRAELLGEMAQALSKTVTSTVKSGSDIVSSDFESDFSGRLVLFHAMHDAALTKKTFEYFFCGASRATGRTATQTENEVHAGEDVVVDGVKFSLKTEGSKSIKKNTLHVSKFMEARWIRDCKSGDDFATMARSRIGRHLSHYQRIISLRSFRTDHGFLYQLVEIPKPVLERVSTLRAADFSSRTENGSSSAGVLDSADNLLFVLSLDGSVEKVTIRRLSIEACTIHATWDIQLH